MSKEEGQTGSCRCRPMTLDDLDRVVVLHLSTFPGFFLSFMGSRFLREFYRATLEDPGSLALVAQDDRQDLLGFVVGHIEPQGSYRRLLFRRGWAFGMVSVLPVIRRPKILPRLLRAVWYRGNPPEEIGGALLASLAVTPHKQGRGLGKLLVSSFVSECQSRGAAYVYLTTDRDDNPSVNSFYRKLGWTLDRELMTPEGRWLNRFRYDWPLPSGQE
ncbi:MAG: GNAT family N-acetyltransferase [Terriglobia bacterium]